MANNTNFDEDEVPDEAIEMFQDYVKNELQASETMEDLARNHSVEDIAKASEIVVSRVLSNVETVDREKKIYIMLGRVGESVGSEYMMKRAQEGLQTLNQG